MDFCFLMLELLAVIGADFVLCRFMHFLGYLAGFLVQVGIFPCLVVRKPLKTALFAFCKFDDVYCRWSRLRERVCFLVENLANNI